MMASQPLQASVLGVDKTLTGETVFDLTDKEDASNLIKTKRESKRVAK